ncbi:MAG: dockerin type I repeat-containing protein [Oscillospiraceae bacterium]|nr:dockerin type I repeat-containing protein [Oscillospiraceae bacterium]
MKGNQNMRKICHYFFAIPILLTCMFSIGQNVLAAEELSPNLKAATIIFDPSENETADYVKGDINGDGSFDVLDVVLLQKWLLSVPGTSLANWQAVDFCKDNQLNIFDLCIMKRELIKDQTTMENKDSNAVHVNMPTIVDDYDEITNDMKEMIWKKLESQYPTTDLTDFTFVYEPKHPFSKAVKGWIFSIYYKDILLRGLGTTMDDVYAIVISKQNQCERVDIHFIVDPIDFSKIDVTAHCISKSEAVSPDMYVEEPELIIYTVWNELPCLAYRAVKENEEGEYIINAITGEILEYIPYYFT